MLEASETRFSPNSQRIPTGLPISKPSGPVLIGDGDREAGDSPLWSNSDQTQSVRFVSPFSWYSPAQYDHQKAPNAVARVQRKITLLASWMKRRRSVRSSRICRSSIDGWK